jgi:putative transposase
MSTELSWTFRAYSRALDNAKIESFIGRLREECLNAHWFLALEDARRKIEAWPAFYNEVRPHTALNWLHALRIALMHCRS